MAILDPVFFQAVNLAEVWTRGLWHAFEYGRIVPVDEGSFKGHKRLQFDALIIHVTHPWAEPMIPVDVPPGVPVPTDRPSADEYTTQLMEKSTGDKSNLVYGYGDFVHDQMNWYIKHFKATGHGNNHCYITVGDPESYKAYEDNEEGKRHSPCLRGIDCKIVGGALHCGFIFRSWDFFAGAPNNMFAIEMMKQYMAGEIGVENGELIAQSMGAHLYDYQWESAAAALKKPLPLYLRMALTQDATKELFKFSDKVKAKEGGGWEK